ncbi:uncharacterized protein G2W53_034002 [Senna tora]|uniref:Uncharacterized protein n=1 Tax=Senna tora TaxID=362788 RepID=A0A834T0K1_9FABA|nr:uncharacterized protein G2W53_034002 [Senna tora]
MALSRDMPLSRGMLICRATPLPLLERSVAASRLPFGVASRSRFLKMWRAGPIIEGCFLFPLERGRLVAVGDTILEEPLQDP